MKKLNKIIIALSIASVSSAFASECADESEHAKAIQLKKEEIKAQIEAQIDTTVNVDNSPYTYENPDAGCDLGFSLPGLPAFGFDLTGIDSCKLLKAVTGDMVKSINNDMKSAVDGAIKDIAGTNDLELEVDLGEMAEDELKNQIE